MLPFVQKMEWWRNGLAGAWPSLLCYVAGVAGFYRLARRLVVPRWAFAATAFYALNPNLLYLATTAMTEPLFFGAADLGDAADSGVCGGNSRGGARGGGAGGWRGWACWFWRRYGRDTMAGYWVRWCGAW